MCAFLTFLLLCAAETTGAFALLFFLPLAFCMLPLCEERLYGSLIFCDLLIVAAVLALPVPHYAWLAFVCVLGPFVPIRHALNGMKKLWLRTLLPVLIVAAWTALIVFGLRFLDIDLLTMFSLPITAAIGLGILLFLFLLDILYQLLLRWYRNGLRRFLLPRA